jgi:hypothetical protein
LREMPLTRTLTRLLFVQICLVGTNPVSSIGATLVVFNRDVRPILSENCFACHGPDPAARKADLRLDTKAGFFEGTPKRSATVVPGKPESSELWRRVSTTDLDDVMPPPKSHKELKPVQKDLIKRWIEEGAPWQGHWSFLKPERPAVPSVSGDAGQIRNPIDAFLLAALATKGLSYNSEADRRILARRLALDLTGLPPTPEQVQRFVRDRSGNFYEHYVDELIRSAHYGEHRARYWLDAARYADTHGLHFDNFREIWPYRDWVIRAFNRNEPFDQFTIEQLAGDLLPDATDEQRTATGFHRCNITTNEAGSIEEENLVNYARDRVETTSWVWLGLTANCAVCHDHKFDPITTKEFYSFSAFFRNTVQTGFDGNVKDSQPNLVLVSNKSQRERWQKLPKEIEAARVSLQIARTNAEVAITNWLGNVSPEILEREIFGMKGLVARLPLNDGSTNDFSVIKRGVTNRLMMHGSAELRKDGKHGPAPKLAESTRIEVSGIGDFERNEAFSAGGWFYLPNDYNNRATMLGRIDDEQGLRGWELWHEQGQVTVHLIHRWPDNMLKVRSKNRIGRRGGWQHVMFTYDGSSRPEGIHIFTDGKPADLEVDKLRELRGTIRTKAPFTLAQRKTTKRLPEMSVQEVRLYDRALSPVEVKALADLPNMKDWFIKPEKEKKAEWRQSLGDYYVATRDIHWKRAFAPLLKLEQEREAIRLNNQQTHVQQEKTNSMGVAHVLFRGQYDKRKDEVTPSVFSALHSYPENAPKNRLGLAQWVASPDNPLTARVTVNRFWQEIFGTGLVKTSEDFGIMGDPPSHPELLDWLAVEFRESGWDVKHMLKLMVTSAAYRQSASVTAEKLEKDPANRLLSRGPRFRMDAEMIRDMALSASSLLAPAIGGPSVKPYQPPGVWEAVAMPESNTRYYDPDIGEGSHRRSMYTIWKRSAPPALMDLFNAPSRETACLRRERTDTPLQALATLNDPQFVEAARHLAEICLRAGRKDFDKILNILSERLLARQFSPAEREVIQSNLREMLEYYQANPVDAHDLVSVGEMKPARSLNVPELAAWTMIANQVLNLDEALNK